MADSSAAQPAPATRPSRRLDPRSQQHPSQAVKRDVTRSASALYISFTTILAVSGAAAVAEAAHCSSYSANLIIIQVGLRRILPIVQGPGQQSLALKMTEQPGRVADDNLQYGRNPGQSLLESHCCTATTSPSAGLLSCRSSGCQWLTSSDPGRVGAFIFACCPSISIMQRISDITRSASARYISFTTILAV